MTPSHRTHDEVFMRRAIRLAMEGRGLVEPNPMVGCVIVKEGRVIGEGWHERYGQPHAEPNALSSCVEGTAGATAYVTLEPCCHTAKQTPPCVPRLIGARLRRVVVGCADPNPQVSGGGIALLRAAGVDVNVGICGNESRQLLAPFIARMRHGRPYVTLKWARSADGKVAGAGGRPVRITNARATAAVHDLRSRCDAILVGVNTVLSDDPLLTARDVPILRPLSRLVLDRDLRCPPASRLAQTAGEHSLTIYTSSKALEERAVPATALRDRGVRIAVLPLDAAGMLSLPHLLRDVGRTATHLIVEPGPTLARSFMAASLADRVWLIQSKTTLSEPAAIDGAEVGWPAVAEADLDGDLLSEHFNPESDVFFHPSASANLERVAGRLNSDGR